MKLTGDRNECPGCAEFFNSSFAFEKHRAGEFGKDRRCLTVDEMNAKGMCKNAAGFWISSAMPADVSHSRPMSEGEEVAFASMARAAGWIGYQSATMGTYDQFAAPEQFRTNSDPAKDATSATAQRQPDGIGESPTNSNQPVSQDRQPGPRITDEQREAAITRAARAMEHHMANLRAINNRDPHIFSDFADAAAARWKAQRARELMEQLIAGRKTNQTQGA